MWIEVLTEIVPGLVVLGYVLLWWQAHMDLCMVKREWSEFVSMLAKADSWDEASILLKAYNDPAEEK